jgi:copper homeostasis protein
MRVEISVESADGVRVAARAGAARVELCAGLSDGGLTPSAALIEAAAELAEVHVLVLQQLARNWDGSDIRLHHY